MKKYDYYNRTKENRNKSIIQNEKNFLILF